MNVLNIETYSLNSKSNEFTSEPPYKFIIQIVTVHSCIVFGKVLSTVKTPKLCHMSL